MAGKVDKGPIGSNGLSYDATREMLTAKAPVNIFPDAAIVFCLSSLDLDPTYLILVTFLSILFRIKKTYQCQYCHRSGSFPQGRGLLRCLLGS